MVGPNLRALDVEAANNTSRLTYAKMSEYFVLPPLPDEFEKFTTLVAIFDGVAMAAYARHITPHLAAEAEHASVAYCQNTCPCARRPAERQASRHIPSRRRCRRFPCPRRAGAR